MNVLDTEMSKAFVMSAIGQLVEGDLAEWNRTADGELELRLASGESFLMGDGSITSQKRLTGTISLPSIHLFARTPG
jgi:hypothetical protein